MHNGKQIKLCGCSMAIKTFLQAATCPIEAWSYEGTSTLENFLSRLKDTLTPEDQKELKQLYESHTGKRALKTRVCPECAVTMIKELKNLIG